MRISYLIAVVLLLSACTDQPKAPIQRSLSGPVSLVNPLIGTAPSTTPSALEHSEAESELKGQVYPATGVPFGMTQWTPQTRSLETKCLPPYYYNDTRIQGFRASHWMSGSCTQDYGSVTISAITGDLHAEGDSVSSAFSHGREFSSPAYYAVDLPDYGIFAEMTATSRAGILRFTVEQADTVHLVFRPNSDEGAGFVEVRAGRQEISGYNPAHRIYQGWGESAGFSGHFAAQYNLTPIAHGVIQGRELYPDATTSKGARSQVGAWVSFVLSPSDTLLVKVGTSFSNDIQARKNLESEIPAWDFEGVLADAEAGWNSFLGKAKVEGDSLHQTQFYTALYHSGLLPRAFSDVDGTYRSFAGGTQLMKAEGYTYYADFSMWDTYRALHPLLTILEPERSVDMMRSIIDKAEQGSWMPIFPAWNQYTSAMIGDHAVVTLTDAFRKGIGTETDMARAYPYMRKNAFESPATEAEYKDGKGRRALKSYLQYGYVPLEDSVLDSFHKREQVSRTLEYSFDDFALAQTAKLLGKDSDYQQLIKRAANYKNVFDTEVGFVRGRKADGSWDSPFDATINQPYITEGTPWHYTWYVPHDPQGLAQLMGGPDAYITKLDQLFDQGLYWHGNEPGHQIPYLFSCMGAPWKTQQRVHDILISEYGPGPGGLTGNEDGGQMSAWYVFSSLGLYPVTPGQPIYMIGSPHFESAELSLPAGKTFTIRANGVSGTAIYIQSATLNGEPFDQAWIRHATIATGGELVFEMGETPNKNWGATALPPNEMGE